MDPEFKSACNKKKLELLYGEIQKRRIQLASALESKPQDFREAARQMPWDYFLVKSIPVNALNKEATALLWHQRLIHSGTHTYKDLHTKVDGIPDLSGFKFDDLTKCTTCMKAHLSKNPSGPNSLRTRVTQPYQGLYVDFAFSGKVLKD